MNYNIEYLLRYVSNDTYKKILKNKSNYILSLVEDNYIDTDLNIKYLIKYGVKNIDKIVYDSLEDLTISHNEYINKIKDYNEEFWRETRKNMNEGVSIIVNASKSLNSSVSTLNEEFYERLNNTLANLDACIQAMYDNKRRS